MSGMVVGCIPTWCWVLHLVLRVVGRPNNKKRQDEDGSSC